MADTVRDPDAVDPVWQDWSGFLATGETIVSSDWFFDAPPDSSLTIIANSAGISGALTFVWITGGTVGKTYRLTNRITTSSVPIARVQDDSFTILVKQL